MSYLKVEGTNFIKDTRNNALLMTGKSALAENEARKSLSKVLSSRNEEINNLKSEIKTISDDVQEIKNLLTILLKQSKD
jgi:hypothetical protein